MDNSSENHSYVNGPSSEAKWRISAERPHSRENLGATGGLDNGLEAKSVPTAPVP